jgi:hypothetical protein
MRIHKDGFVLQDRGPYQFDRWQWPERLPTALGDLVVELTTRDGESPPDAAMAAAANELAEFVASNGDLVLDMIYGHYKYAEENDWLRFWGVRPGLRRNRVLSQVKSVDLTVRRGRDGRLDAAVFVNPRWDPEHKLDLSFRDGQIVAVNGEPFAMDGEILRPASGGPRRAKQ